MAVVTLADAIAGTIAHDRTARARLDHATRPAPVRRESIEAGSFESHFFVAPAAGETDRLLRMARAALDAGRRLKRRARREEYVLTAAERLLADLTAGAIRVYEELLTLARLNRGCVFPSYDHLSKATALGRATVARGLCVLERAGFLVRRRRFVRLPNERAGPRYAQTSNVYRMTLPGRVLSLLPRKFRPSPPPQDSAHQRDAAAAAMREMEASLSCREFAATVSDSALGAALARLGAAMDRRLRESQNDAETHHESIDTLSSTRMQTNTAHTRR